MAASNYYSILGIKKSASSKEIKSAYRKLVLQFHPDKTNHGSSYTRFSQIQRAYETLIDPEKRKSYDYGLRFPGFKLQKGSVDRKTIYIEIEKRTPGLGDLVPVRIVIKKAANHFRLRGLGLFEIVEGPLFQVTEDSGSATETHVLYLLRPQKTGYIQIGPASISINGKDYLSEPIYINVAKEKRFRYRPSTRLEKTIYGFVALFLIGYISIVGYNYYRYNVKKDQQYLSYGSAEKIVNSKTPTTGSSPYNSYYGAGLFDNNSFNEIRFINSPFYDAIVCLADYQTNQVIRNNFIASGMNYTMSQIPDGIYFLKVFFGKSWRPDKPLNNNALKGGFEEGVQFDVYNQRANLLYMQKSEAGDTLNYRIYEITLFPIKTASKSAVKSTEFDFFN